MALSASMRRSEKLRRSMKLQEPATELGSSVRGQEMDVSFPAQESLAGVLHHPSWDAHRVKAWSSSVPRRASSRNSQRVTDSQSHDATDTEFIRLIAIGLLSSCTTINTFTVGLSLPEAFYNDREKIKITALEMHRLMQCSPAAGHHARNPSTAPQWPSLYDGENKEESLVVGLSENGETRDSQHDGRKEGAFW